jgi:hypothetical protein
MILHTEPSPYMLLDKVFSVSDYNKVLEFANTGEYGDNFLTCDCELFTMLQNKAWDLFNQLYPELSSVTNDKFSNDVDAKGNNSFFRILIKKLPPGWKRNRIHRDSAWKQLVVVIYLSDQGIGTKIYANNNEDSLVTTLPFEPNTGYATIPNKTNWHDFDHPATFDKDRITLMFVMADKRYYK